MSPRQSDPGAVLVFLPAGCTSLAFLSHISVGFQSQAPKSHMHRSSCPCPGLILATAALANQATSTLSSASTFTRLWQSTHMAGDWEEKSVASIFRCAFVSVMTKDSSSCLVFSLLQISASDNSQQSHWHTKHCFLTSANVNKRLNSTARLISWPTIYWWCDEQLWFSGPEVWF